MEKRKEKKSVGGYNVNHRVFACCVNDILSFWFKILRCLDVRNKKMIIMVVMNIFIHYSWPCSCKQAYTPEGIYIVNCESLIVNRESWIITKNIVLVIIVIIINTIIQSGKNNLIGFITERKVNEVRNLGFYW